jgi:hypothetical protein
VVIELPKVVLVLAFGVLGMLERWIASPGVRLADVDRQRTETDRDARHGLRSTSDARNGVSTLPAAYGFTVQAITLGVVDIPPNDARGVSLLLGVVPITDTVSQAIGRLSSGNLRMTTAHFVLLLGTVVTHSHD